MHSCLMTMDIRWQKDTEIRAAKACCLRENEGTERSLNLDRINNNNMERGRTNNWRASIITSEFIKHNPDTYRDECINRKWEQGVMVKTSVQQGEDLQAHAMLLCKFSVWNKQPISGSCFHPIKSTAWAITQMQKMRESDLFRTQSILRYFQALSEATHFMLLSDLWSFHCPLSPPQGKMGASQIHPFNYLLVVLVNGKGKKWHVFYNKCTL